jgi:hypothetical protein
LSIDNPAFHGAGEILELVGLIIDERNTKAQLKKPHHPLATDRLGTLRPMLTNRRRIDVRKPIAILIHRHPEVMICGKRRVMREFRGAGQSAQKRRTPEGELQKAGHRHSVSRVISKRREAGELRLRAANRKELENFEQQV